MLGKYMPTSSGIRGVVTNAQEWKERCLKEKADGVEKVGVISVTCLTCNEVMTVGKCNAECGCGKTDELNWRSVAESHGLEELYDTTRMKSYSDDIRRD